MEASADQGFPDLVPRHWGAEVEEVVLAAAWNNAGKVSPARLADASDILRSIHRKLEDDASFDPLASGRYTPLKLVLEQSMNTLRKLKRPLGPAHARLLRWLIEQGPVTDFAHVPDEQGGLDIEQGLDLGLILGAMGLNFRSQDWTRIQARQDEVKAKFGDGVVSWYFIGFGGFFELKECPAGKSTWWYHYEVRGYPASAPSNLFLGWLRKQVRVAAPVAP
jgi:hypothetical protein